MKTGRTRSPATAFKAVLLPTDEFALLPKDLTVLIPRVPAIALEDRHYLAYIPWSDKFLRHIPRRHQEFFNFILPCLHTRTSDVHTALSVAQLPDLLDATAEPVDERIIYLALMLHDCGWNQVDQEGLVTSLSYNSVSPSGSHHIKPKQQHLIYGTALAYRLLDAFDFGDSPLSPSEIYEITDIIRRHDHDAAWEHGKYGDISMEIKLVCDSDRLWSYTNENFWLDTIRKGVAPEMYIQTISDEIESYFFTEQGKARARQLVDARRQEVESYAAVMENTKQRDHLYANAYRPTTQLTEKARRVSLYLKSRRLQRLPLRREAY
jgi:hypothetical protein